MLVKGKKKEVDEKDINDRRESTPTLKKNTKCKGVDGKDINESWRESAPTPKKKIKKKRC